MTLQEIEDAIVTQCEKRRAEGWTIVKETYGSAPDKTCCPLASFEGVLEWARTTGRNPPPLFSLGKKEFIQIRRGVDGMHYHGGDYYDLGVRVRERLGL